MNDKHAVFAVLDGERIRVSRWHDSYGEAIEHWYALDDIRLSVNRQTSGWTNVDYFCVRHIEDPAWNKAPHQPSRIAATRGTGNLDDTPVIRTVGERLGYHGRVGGWIYTQNDHPITQGWRSFRRDFERQGRLVVRSFDIEPNRFGARTQTRYFSNRYDVEAG